MSANKSPSTDRFLTGVQNPDKALSALQRSSRTPITEPRDLSGIVKDFELTYELAWKCLKKFLETEGHEVKSAREAFSKAYQLEYIDDESIWLAILANCTHPTHTYDEKFAREMGERIKNNYVSAFEKLRVIFPNTSPAA